jgi:hypothetical protein
MEQLSENWSDIHWWESTAYPYVLNELAVSYHKLNGADFVSVPDEDWDNMIILDACRYDIFEKLNCLSGVLHKKYSKAPQSAGFFDRNFGDRTFYDIVSVTGNPYHEVRLTDEQFHKVYHLWKTHWTEDISSIHPKDVTDATLEISDSHPKKRLMVHFMQPHAPFIGPWAREQIGIHVGNTHVRQLAEQGEYSIETKNPYSLAKSGEIDSAQLRRGYKENLNIVLEQVDRLLSGLEGKTVVTADHGELFGERAWPFFRREYQHPNIMATKLLEVPWLVIDSDERKNIKSEPPETDSTDGVETNIEQRLHDLGYK